MPAEYPLNGHLVNPFFGPYPETGIPAGGAQNAGMEKAKRIRSRPVDELSIKKRMGLNLKALRESAGASQEAFAEELGLPLATYKKWENGTSYPQADGITLLAEMGYDVNFLYLGYGPKRREERNKNKGVVTQKARATG